MSILKVLASLVADPHSVRELAALAVVAQRPGCSLRDVSAELLIAKPCAQRCLDLLVAEGLLDRVDCDRDARLVRQIGRAHV